MHFRPIRPYFYKPVAILGVPMRDWKISLTATVTSAVVLFFVWRNFYGFPIWFIFSLGIGIGLTMFFIWAHNTRRRGWIEFTLRFYRREIIGIGQDLLPEKAGRTRTKWLKDADNSAKPKWLERA